MSEFPLLNVYGIRGCGKTQGVMRLCELFGVDYGRSADVLMAPSLTNFALWKAGSSSETAPIILDEFNVGPGKLTRQRQGEQAEYLKSHYQRGVVSRGTVSTCPLPTIPSSWNALSKSSPKGTVTPSAR